MQLIDHYSSDWASETQAMIDAWLAQAPRASVYFLLDASFRHETLLALIRKLWPENCWRSLYQDAPNTSERVLAISPLLLAVDSERLDALDALAKETSGQPMLSLIVSDESMDSLWERLSVFRLVTVQNARYVLRLTDTRRLPQITEMLTEEQRARLMSHMAAWRYIGRDANWHDLDITLTSEPGDMRDVRLDERQTQTLLDMNRIDALVDGLRQHEPTLHDAFATPSQRYAWVEETLANAAGPVDGYPEQIECCRSAAIEQGWWPASVSAS
ncbi:DUF4123 domain-containing protein [Chromohalobacter nigrandesensis]|uniref:DUF4123 domain-containing protein n=1 Tax=Chromohalobacter nigrandesensis TaxID=119863 RepID=UPI001FF2E44A|nr:DUF4123 domain-containing protein [Chromohalobacter nigrandesensis]MCK0745080.1 DUF4123 domain-containing protein [Chromohalobacter nigrandesensis]